MSQDQSRTPPLTLSSKDYTNMTDDELRQAAEAGDIHAQCLWTGVDAYNRTVREIREKAAKKD